LRNVAPQDVQEADMLWAIFVASLVFWAFGVVSSHTIGGRIHVLLALAILVILVRIVQGYREPLDAIERS